jgi:hypothetical protein
VVEAPTIPFDVSIFFFLVLRAFFGGFFSKENSAKIEKEKVLLSF